MVLRNGFDNCKPIMPRYLLGCFCQKRLQNIKCDADAVNQVSAFWKQQIKIK